MKNKFKKAQLQYFCAAALLVLLFLFLSYARVFDAFEYNTLDLRYSIRPPRDADKDIVIIEVGDDSIAKIGQWPFPRSYHALLTNALKASGARKIVFDIFFSEQKEGDDEFALAAREAGNVYMPYIFELDRGHPDRRMIHASGYAAPLIEELRSSVRNTGFINVKPDIDGKVRRIPPVIEYMGEYYPHLTFLVALNDRGYSWEQVKVYPGKKIVAANELVIPLEEDSSVLVNYPAVWGKAFRHYSYVDILQSYLAGLTGQTPIIDLSELEGAVCFIGLTATAAPDAHPSPMEPLYPGVGVHTSLYDSILRGDHIVRLSRTWNVLLVLVLGVISALATYSGRKRVAVVYVFAAMFFYFVFAFLVFWILGVWVDVFYPLISIGLVYVVFTFLKYIGETRKREVLEKELDIAKDIQQSFLPVEMPSIGEFQIDVRMLTAMQVGGDLYDVLQLGGNRLGVMLGDVAGKGVSAALFMAKTVSIFKACAGGGSTARTLKELNERLIEESRSNLFVTLVYLVFDGDSGKVQFSSAGHLPVIAVKPDGEVVLLEVNEGFPLGLIEGEYGREERYLEKGTLIFLYSDGVTEAMDKDEEMFGQERLVELCGKMSGYTPAEAVEAVHRAVSEFAGKAKQHDDITVLVVKT